MDEKAICAKDQWDAENHEPVTVVRHGVSNPVNKELDIGGDNQDKHSSQKSIPNDADDFAEVSANVEVNAPTLHDDAEGSNNDKQFFA